MTRSLVVRAVNEPEQPSPAREFMEVVGLKTTLIERLPRDASGQTFEPVQLDPQKDPLTQLAYLTRREPVGGAEPQIQDNTRRLREHMQAQLNRALAATLLPPRPLLAALASETRALKERLVERFGRADGAYTATQTQLHRWQDHIGQRSGGLGDLWRWIFGGPERLSLPEVVALWNKREHQALDRGACSAALELATWFLDIITDLLDRLDQLLAEAGALRAHMQRQRESLRQPAVFAPWTMPVDAWTVAGALVERANLDGLVAELLRQQTDSAGAGLEGQASALAREEANRLLEAVGIVELIELEAYAGGAEPEDDPLILVGQELLQALQQPTWRLARGARPRLEMLQVTPDGAPVYGLDGLASAAYGETRDRLGFVQVQSGVAQEDLALLREGDEAFTAALQQRNLYVLDELAIEWERAQGQAAHVAAGLPIEPGSVQLTDGRAVGLGSRYVEEE
jgi:PHD/YefM family antitoxin component YafN of YafNO toxin-antitoxin module